MVTADYSAGITIAMDTMAKNPSRPFSNEALARLVGMSTNAFIRLFTREAGMPPQKWHRERRIDNAAFMLSHTHKTIEEIAEAVGFRDRAHFSRVFARLLKCGPAAYRKKPRA
jgi:transcriptional regulator GlxA family with amidase domain